MITAIYRILKLGAVAFWRNGWLSMATISVMIISLLVFEGLIIFGVITGTALTSVQDKIDISTYFKTATSEDDVLNVKNALENLAEVKSVEYISRDEALEIFKAAHIEDTDISEALQILDDNPLSASLNIKAHEPQQYETIATYLSDSALADIIENVTYRKNQVVIDRLTSIITIIQRGGLILTVFLSLIAGLVIFNTIRLAIYSNREEIGIMRLVGASDRFIRGPYIVEGFLYGIVASIIGILISIPIIYLSSPFIMELIPELDLIKYFTSNFFSLLSYQVLFGVVLGVLSSIVSIRRHLKV